VKIDTTLPEKGQKGTLSTALTSPRIPTGKRSMKTKGEMLGSSGGRAGQGKGKKIRWGKKGGRNSSWGALSTCATAKAYPDRNPEIRRICCKQRKMGEGVSKSETVLKRVKKTVVAEVPRKSLEKREQVR